MKQAMAMDPHIVSKAVFDWWWIEKGHRGSWAKLLPPRSEGPPEQLAASAEAPERGDEPPTFSDDVLYSPSGGGEALEGQGQGSGGEGGGPPHCQGLLGLLGGEPQGGGSKGGNGGGGGGGGGDGGKGSGDGGRGGGSGGWW